jgi:ribosome-binding protein aMBF1 (putative translation factor)
VSGDDRLLQRFGRRVTRERDHRGWSMRELARKADVSVSTVQRAERATGDLYLSLAACICAALGVPLSQMVADAECDTCDGMPPAGFICEACGQRQAQPGGAS